MVLPLYILWSLRNRYEITTAINNFPFSNKTMSVLTGSKVLYYHIGDNIVWENTQKSKITSPDRRPTLFHCQVLIKSRILWSTRY